MADAARRIQTPISFWTAVIDAFRLPLLNVRMPRLMMKVAMRLGAALSVRPLLRQDGWAVESEQVGYEANFEAPIVELNPAVHLFQELTVRKWEDYLDRQQATARR
jgi:hypothetical protein